MADLPDVPDALSGGKIVKISTELLTDFAGKNLKGFLDDLHDNEDLAALTLFADGADGDGPALNPDRDFSVILPGATKNLSSANHLRSKFTSLAKLVVHTHIGEIRSSAETMQENLMAAASNVDAADWDAALKAEDMRTDLNGVNGSGSGSSSGSGSGSSTEPPAS